VRNAFHERRTPQGGTNLLKVDRQLVDGSFEASPELSARAEITGEWDFSQRRIKRVIPEAEDSDAFSIANICELLDGANSSSDCTLCNRYRIEFESSSSDIPCA
jgi:hypothetical protein